MLRGVLHEEAAHEWEPVWGKEHMLGPAKADAAGAECHAALDLLGGFRIDSNLDSSLADLVRPREQGEEFGRGVKALAGSAPA